jgi:hypothetical protein
VAKTFPDPWTSSQFIKKVYTNNIVEEAGYQDLREAVAELTGVGREPTTIELGTALRNIHKRAAANGRRLEQVKHDSKDRSKTNRWKVSATPS